MRRRFVNVRTSAPGCVPVGIRATLKTQGFRYSHRKEAFTAEYTAERLRIADAAQIAIDIFSEARKKTNAALKEFNRLTGRRYVAAVYDIDYDAKPVEGGLNEAR